jgi:REP element-mobilizing transposase RayT
MAEAYFITFTTYGTWLHGDTRTSVDRQHNAFGTPLVSADLGREHSARASMSQDAHVMTSAERKLVCDAIVSLATEKSWQLWAVHVRTNHVHLVITADREPGRLMSDIKARATRELVMASHGTRERRRWTRHGSTRHLWKVEDIEAAVNYTLDEQGERFAYFDHRESEPRTK